MPVSQIFQIDSTISPTVNFAMQQNHVPVIRRLVIHNLGNQDLSDLTLRIATLPSFTVTCEKYLAFLPAQTPLDVGLVELQPAAAYLAGLTERLSGELIIELLDNQNQSLYRETTPLGILAFDEWGGLASMPEMLCAFVTPNHPALAPLLRDTAQYLQQWTGDPSLDGYQSQDPNRIRRQAAAVYAALQARQIVYCQPPASFEISGQRVRLADAVLAQKMGTCLDLTLLYASCLEAIGLNVLVNLIKGHAFVGVWLNDQCFAESILDDVSALEKRLSPGMQELILIETTALTAGQTSSFEDAEKLAVQHLKQEEDFVCTIDLRRARASGIHPLPQRIQTADGWQVDPAGQESGEAAAKPAPAPADLEQQQQNLGAAGQPPLTRQKQWERKLLDLSLRNSLLSFRTSRNTVRLFARQLDHFEDLLSCGEDFQILERPQDWISDQRDPRSFEKQFNLDPYQELLDFEFSQKRLRTPLDAAELNLAMTGLYRTARSSMEENGANTLYLALGFLKWYETAASQQPRYAPVVLIPVDIVRRSASKGYVIRSRDEEPQVNITLLELLRQNFGMVIGGLDPLPHDDKGVDLKAVLNIFRQAILRESRWTILDEAYLGIFSFTRFIMWNDIRNRSADLARNPVVASLLAGHLTWQPEELLPADTDLDDLYAPDSTFLPVSADASQLLAVHAAGEGNSFVLHGPPGTGKSQTITNIIGNALARGQTVLFVAEKMAALSVVQRRLENIGLGSFCLELHSNKSRKKDVLEQLRRTTEISRTVSPVEFGRQADRLHQLRVELKAYVRQLYHHYPFGLSLFDAISRSGELADARAGVVFDPAVFASLEQATVDQWFSLIGELTAAARDSGGPFGHPLGDFQVAAWSQNIKTSAADQLRDFAAALDGMAPIGKQLAESLDFARYLPAERLESLTDPAEIGRQLQGEADLLAQVCRLVGDLPRLPTAILRQKDLPVSAAHLKSLFVQGQLMSDCRRELLVIYQESVLVLDGQALLNAWQHSQLQWLIPRLAAEGRILKILQPHALAGTRLAKKQLESQLQLLVQFQAARQQVDQQYPVLQAPLAGFWRNLDTDWQGGLQYAGQLPVLHQHILTLTGRPAAVNAMISLLADCLDDPSGRTFLGKYAAAYTELSQRQQSLASLLGIRFDQLLQSGDSNGPADWFSWLAPRVTGWIAHLEQLREWCIWRSVRERAVQAGLQPAVDALAQGVVQVPELAGAFEKGFYQAAAAWIISQEPALDSFSGQLFEEKIRQFQQTFDNYEQLTRQEIFARLSARIPQFAAEAAQSSELGILQRAIKSNGRGQSIRKLFEQLPNLLVRLAPCMLMSPISVAQYLDPRQALFDLVVFDEASQMPTSEAVGAMARGRHVVVVGDPCQLPPTSFFAINQVDEDNFATEDLESVLDDCLALAMPQTHLLWHYRSRHESLIAFSNRQYYENKLLTFPSPNDLVSKVQLISVDGVYDRGRTKQNPAEAKAVVDEVLRRLADPALCRQSLGIVSFSSVQQNLIDDCLTEAFKERPDLEELAMQGLEPIFVKNLENVQGDERDVILFSVGYGPDKTGHVSMNFGPLNRDGGWRRLNVAVSRARCEMLIFSTIRPDQLDASRTAALGVAGLRAFLEYARHGRQALPFSAEQARAASSAAHDFHAAGAAGLAAQIANTLEESGYQTQLLIGSSGYRIDIGVVHPECPGEYILGILCNGSTYRNARTTRDREILQQTILRQLGWQLHQIWAVDWWENPAKEIRRLIQHIEKLRQEKPGDLPQPPANLQTPAVQAAPTTPAAPSAPTAPPATAVSPAPPAPAIAASAVRMAVTTRAAASSSPAPVPPEIVAEYQPASLSMLTIATDELIKPGRKKFLTDRLTVIIDGEGPLSRRLLYRRLLQSCGISRLSPRLESCLDDLTTGLGRLQTGHGDDTFFWARGQEPQKYSTWRTARDESSRRQPEDLPAEETAAALRQILEQQIGLPRVDLIREAARLMGYARLGPAIEKACQRGVELAVSRGWAVEGRDDCLSCGREN